MIRRPPKSTLMDTLVPDTAPLRPRRAARGGAGRCHGNDDPEPGAGRDRLPWRTVQGSQPRPEGRQRPAEPDPARRDRTAASRRSEEHTSELQSLMHILYSVFCLKTKKIKSTIKDKTAQYITN